MSVGRVEAAGGNQGERTRRRAVDRVMARHPRPAAERDDRAVLLGVGVAEPDGAFDGQPDRGELWRAVVRQALEALDDAVAPRHVDTVARGRKTGQHAVALLDHGCRRRELAVDRQAQQLEARRVVRAAQVQPGPGVADAVDLGAGVVHLGPARGAGQDVLQRRAVQRLFPLDAVVDDRERDVLSRHRHDGRAVAAVERHGRVHARAEHDAIGVGLGQAPQVGAVVHEALGPRARLPVRGEPAVEEPARIRQPLHAAAADAIDRRRHLLAGGRVDHVQRADLGAGRGQRVGDERAVGRRLERADGVRLAGGLGDRVGIDQQPFGAVERVAAIQLQLVVGGGALQVGQPAARIAVHATDDGRDLGVDLGDTGAQRVTPGQPREDRRRGIGLLLHPRLHRGVGGVLEEPVRILHRHAPVHVDDRLRRQRRRDVDAREGGRLRGRQQGDEAGKEDGRRARR